MIRHRPSGTGLLAVSTLAVALGAAGDVAAGTVLPIAPDTQIGFDLGPTITNVVGNDWNDFTNLGSMPTVHNLNGEILPGISATLAGGAYTNDGLDDWIGLVSEGGTAPEAFIDSVTTDVGWFAVTLTIAGLDPSETFDLYAVTHGFGDQFDSRQDTVTVTGASVASSSLFRGQSRTQGKFHTFLNVSPSAGGTITVATSGANNQPVLNGLLIDRVPEPGTLGLLAIGGVLVASRRRG